MKELDTQTTKDRSSRGPAWKAAEEYGFDMSIVEANLLKTPAERVRQHCEVLELGLKLRKAMEEARAQGYTRGTG